MRRGFCDDRGNMAVEFALVAPIFLFLLLGLADYGIAAREASNLKAAARAGLQAILIDDEDTAGAEAAAEAVAPGAAVTVTAQCWCSDDTMVACSGEVCSAGAVRKAIEIEVSSDFDLIVPWPGMTDPLPLSGRAKARVQ
jgi:Flp pilus assembly protein TadG